MPSRLTRILLSAALVAALGASLPHAVGAAGGTHAAAVVTLTPEAITWKPGPASLPPGSEVAVIEGDPARPGPFTLRLRFPAGYRVAPHTHPGIEHITVISGVFGAGMGERFDTSKGLRFPAGSFVVMPSGHPHFAWTDEGTVVQLHGMGPWGIDYLNPLDDPRRKVSAK